MERLCRTSLSSQKWAQSEIFSSAALVAAAEPSKEIIAPIRGFCWNPWHSRASESEKINFTFFNPNRSFFHGLKSSFPVRLSTFALRSRCVKLAKLGAKWHFQWGPYGYLTLMAEAKYYSRGELLYVKFIGNLSSLRADYLTLIWWIEPKIPPLASWRSELANDVLEK